MVRFRSPYSGCKNDPNPSAVIYLLNPFLPSTVIYLNNPTIAEKYLQIKTDDDDDDGMSDRMLPSGKHNRLTKSMI